GSKFLEVEVICSNVNTHRSRIEGRISDIEGLKLPDWNAVITRDYEQWDQEHLIIDSSKLSVKQCVETIVDAL
ncbi:adenylyl-sulfate kinase, partial [Salmonella enterica]|nr:adenylyl-sulfate kinase [Salmonella enterica]